MPKKRPDVGGEYNAIAALRAQAGGTEPPSGQSSDEALSFPPKKQSRAMVQISARIPAELQDRVKEAVAERNTTVQAFVRIALERLLDELDA